MTDQELKNIVKSNSIGIKQLTENIDRFSKENAKHGKEIDDRINKSNSTLRDLYKEVAKHGKEVDDRINKLNSILSGVGQNNGDVAEEFFFNGLNEKMKIGKIKFEFIDRNVIRKTRRLQDEFDIVMTNTESVIILEVKYKYHPKDVEKVLNKIKNYKKLFPSYKDYVFYGGIAGLAMPEDTVKKAMDYGLFVLTQSGNSLKVLNDNVLILTPEE